MRKKAGTIILCLLISSLLHQAGAENFNSGWLFRLGNTPSAEEPSFDDSGWRMLDLPHDWAFESGYSIDNAQGEKGGYKPGGIGWYRKHFFLPEQSGDKRTFLDFDAVYMNSEVWINGRYLGKRPYGYISFSYEITDYLKDGENVVCVRVDNSAEPSARWYHGCGIYGNVTLRKENATHFAKNGIHIRTPEITAEKGIISVSYTIDGDNGCTAAARILKDGKQVSGTVSGDDGTLELSVAEPVLWSPDTPGLYELELLCKDSSGKVTDRERTRFGFRTIGWDAEKGFFLNGENFKIRGVCEHLEGGPVGAMWTKELMRWKLQMLKDMGCNAIRTAHNPQLPFFYDLCDEMGLLVLDEAFDGWKQKAAYDYGAQAFDEWWETDLRAMIRRDRNHPCVIAYSVGNETKGDIASDLVRVCHEEDPDRAVTSGHSASQEMDILGINGHSEKYKFMKNYKPGEQAFIGTETPHTWQVRGFYRTKTWYRDGFPNTAQTPFEIPDLTEDEIFGYDWTSPENRKNPKQIFNSSYDNATVRMTARHSIEFLRDLPWYSGCFRWTGFDYLGEAEYVHGGWPFRAFMGGVIDLAGFPKDHYFLYQSQWRDDMDMVHILPHWTHPDMKEGTLIPVWVYTTGDSAELFLDGKSLGMRRKGLQWNEMQCEWMVPWQPGKLTAVAYRNGQKICRTSVSTSGTGRKTDVIHEGSAGNISIITFRMTDGQGSLFPYGDNRVFVNLPDNATMLSFENGNPVDTENNFNTLSRRAFFGLCRAFIKAEGNKGKVIAGSINGDRSLKISDTASIDIHRIDLKTGKISNGNFTVRYTTDGSEPDGSSTLYTGPFKVGKGTVVKAAAFSGYRSVLKMEESFGDGIYWGKPGETWASAAEGLQAEDARLESCKTTAYGSNVHGKGYVTMKAPGSSISWYQENDGSPMVARIRIRYSQDVQENTTEAILLVNGESAGTVRFVNTGSPDADWQHIDMDIPLNNGANNITIKLLSEDSPNIDEIFIEY